MEKLQKATIHQAYPLGSISKCITATGVMNLVNSLKISLFDDIRPLITPIVLKNVAGEKPEIKLWHLLSQNAGLSHGYGTFQREKGRPETWEEKQRFFEKSVVVAFAPGTVYEYSNHSFSIAEMLIEKQSGQEFQAFMAANIFQPLGMTNTYAYPIGNTLQERHLVNIYDSKMARLEQNFIAFPAGGMGFWSSVSDMNQYLLLHLGVKENAGIISAHNLRLMHDFRQGPADLFGIGWFNQNGELISNGNVGGGNASISINKSHGFAVVCLLNRTSWDGIADQFAGKIKDVFIEKNDCGGYESWQRIYGAPYTPRFELNGKWLGNLTEPVSGKSLPVQLDFLSDGGILIKINETESLLKNTVFNLFGELEAGFNAVLPGISNESVRCGLKLKKNGKKLSGYVQYDGVLNDGTDYRLPLFMEILKLGD